MYYYYYLFLMNSRFDIVEMDHGDGLMHRHMEIKISGLEKVMVIHKILIYLFIKSCNYIFNYFSFVWCLCFLKHCYTDMCNHEIRRPSPSLNLITWRCFVNCASCIKLRNFKKDVKGEVLSELSANVSTAKRTYYHDKINNSPNSRMLFKTFSSLLHQI